MRQRDNKIIVTSLTAGFFTPKFKELKMSIIKEKAPQPWTVTELIKTQATHCNSHIKKRKSITCYAKSACYTLLAIGLFTIYSIGGF